MKLYHGRELDVYIIHDIHYDKLVCPNKLYNLYDWNSLNYYLFQPDDKPP